MQRQFFCLVIYFAIVSWTTVSASAEAAPLYEAAILFDTDALRLPNGHMSHNHSPSLAETPEGNLIGCWFHGHGEREDNTMVVLSGCGRFVGRTMKHVRFNEAWVVAGDDGR